MDYLTEPRGRAIHGAKALARYIYSDESRWRAVYGLPREEFGLIELSGMLTGFENWVDAAILARAKAGKRRQARKIPTEAITQSHEIFRRQSQRPHRRARASGRVQPEE
jgi:hypothetical protein